MTSMEIQPTWAVLALLVGALVQGITLAGFYWGLKADNAKLASAIDLALVKEQSSRREEHLTLKETVNGLLASMDNAIKELTRRVVLLESGQNEWTKTLRDRTHDLANKMNTLMLQVDRLERPTAYPPPHSSESE